MANKRIAGITIELDGKTDKLESALKNVNTAIRNTQTQLKDVDRLLKLDPGNAELLRQKYEGLTTAIQSTKDRLETLKTAQEQMAANGDVGTDKWNGLQREIIETEQKLQSLNGEMETFGSVSAQKIAAAGEQVKGVGEKLSGAGQAIMPVSAAVTGLGTAAAAKFAEVDKTIQLVNATMGNSEAEAALLDEAMQQAAANSTFGMSDAANASLNFARAGLDAEQAAAALAPAMNLAAGEGGNLDTVSAGLVATINGFHDSFENTAAYADVFAAACNNSALDVDSLSNAMSVAAPIFSAAGYGVNDAALYMGVMADAGIDANVAANSLKTGLARLVSPAKEGYMAMQKLGIEVTNADGSMKDSVTLQRELHDAFVNLSESEQIAAASAIFGKNQMAPWLALINTAPADVGDLKTELDGAGFSITDFAKQLETAGGSIDEMKANMAQLGVSAEDFDDILKFSGGDADAFADALWEACDSGVGFEDVVAALGGDLDALQGTMDQTKGTTDEMADAMMSGFGGSIEKLKSSVDVLMTTLGGTLAKAVQPAIDAIQRVVDWLNSLDEGTRQIIVTIGLVAAAAGPVLIFVGKLTTALGSIMTTAPKLISTGKKIKGVLAGLASPVGAVVAVIGTLVAAFLHLWNTNEDFRARITAIWEEIKGKFQAFASIVKDRLAALGIDFTTATETLKGIWEGFCQALAPIFEGAFQLVSDVLGTVLDVLLGIVMAFSAAFQGDWQGVWDGVEFIFLAVWNGIETAFSTILNTLKGVANVFLSWFGTDWDTVMNGIRTTASNVWSAITGFFTSAWETIKAVWGTVSGFFADLWNSIVTNPTVVAIATTLSGFFTAAWDLIKAVWDTVAGFFSTLWTNITTDGVLVGIAETFSGFFTTAWDLIKAVWDTVAGFFSTLWTNITTDGVLVGIAETFSGFFSEAWDLIKAVWDTVAGFFSDLWETITTNETLAGITSKISGFFTGAWDVVKTAWDGAVGFFKGIFDDIKEVVRKAVNKLKGFLDFKWELPKIKLPHFTITGKFSLNPPKVPHFGVEWYRKAMDHGMILTNPTIFGAAGGRLLAGGEAGPEAVVGVRSLQDMIRDAVAGTEVERDIVIPQEDYSGRPLNITLMLNEMELGRAVYRLNREESQRVGVSLAKGVLA